MKSIYKWLLLVAMIFGFLLYNKQETKAAPEENISVTVPGNINIRFQSDGTNQTNPFQISNESPVPIQVKNIIIKEYNGWQLVDIETPIEVDQKKLSFLLDGQCLKEGDNLLGITVPEQDEKNLSVEIIRGAWTKNAVLEKALSLEVEYIFGTKAFDITFDGNGSTEMYDAISATNGSSVILPTPFLVKHNFLGWEDEHGILYNGTLTMPMRDLTLTAKWQRTEAYAIYCAEDRSLSFIRSVEPVQPGDVYLGKTITEVYAGIEDKVYNSNSMQPWYKAGGIWGSDIVKVDALDVIQPISTAYWFYNMRDVKEMNLAKMDMSKVADMTSMFSSTGMNVTDRFTIRGIGQWDTSNVRCMMTVFRAMGQKAKQFVMDDIGGWDTSSVEDMLYMFHQTGESGTWHMDLSSWNVTKVKTHTGFCNDNGTKVVQPNWGS